MPEQRQVVYLIDGSSYLYRAFYAVSNLTSPDGTPTNAVMVFGNMLLKILKEKEPKYIGVIFDSPEPSFRTDIYPDYKANRSTMPEDLVVQIPVILQLIELLGIFHLARSGWEADDIIGTLAAREAASGKEVVIVSGDKDFMQLISQDILMWDGQKDLWLGEAQVVEKLGVRPDQVVDFMALTGDTSDNVPGVPGIGPKTAQKLIESFGTLDAIYQHLDQVKPERQRELLARHKDTAYLAKDLVTIRTQAEIEVDSGLLCPGPRDNRGLLDVFSRLGLKKLAAELATAPVEPIEPEKAPEFLVIQDNAGLKSYLDSIRDADRLIFYCVGAPGPKAAATPAGLALMAGAKMAYFPWPWDQDSLFQLQNLLGQPALPKASHDIKAQWQRLRRMELFLDGPLDDLMVASYLLDPETRLHDITAIDDRLTREGDQPRRQLALPLAQDISPKTFAPMACAAVQAVSRHFDQKVKELQAQNLYDLYRRIEMPLVPILAEMESTGVLPDADYLREVSAEIDQKLSDLERDIHLLAEQSFNINSSKQLGFILFDKLGLPQQKKTKKKTAYSTDEEVLELLAPLHPLPAKVMDYRGLAKLKSTFVDGLLAEINPTTGRIHTTYNQTVTATGRLSSSQPNLQNIPVGDEHPHNIRRAFIAPPGQVMLSADYSQIELRVLAHFAQDDTLLQAFREGRDIHAATAIKLFKVKPPDITGDMRRLAKVVNFGVIYGMSGFRLSKELHITPAMANKYIEDYFAQYPGVKSFTEKVIAAAEQTGAVTTLRHRKRVITGITSRNHTIKKNAERMAFNTVIQGSAADIIKEAMIAVITALSTHKFKTKLLMQVHDELVFEVPEPEFQQIATLVKHSMEDVCTLAVPLVVDLKAGPNWGEMKAMQ
ncbi:MAG: DNA polymerase I [Deltaproteobacteria bacterium]|nr:DNA polymerase I [Deltaproteobacteria bacterium]